MPPKDALFIVEKIVEQAVTEDVALSDIERKILLFSESSPVLPDAAETNEAFDRDYNSVAYEAKVTKLIQHIRTALRGDATANRTWEEAIRNLQGEDYYFMVMLNEAGFNRRPPGDVIRLIAAAIAIVSVLVFIVVFFRTLTQF